MSKHTKYPLIVIAGPTAVGKTAVSVRTAHKLNGSVISADSMQVYRAMDIGSAKISSDEMEGVPHYLVDCLEPEEEWNVFRFRESSLHAMEQIRREGRLPLLVGGTGFYVDSVVYDTHFEGNGSNQEYRNRLEQVLKKDGPEKLHHMLQEIDPETAEAVHVNNVKRVIRSLEFYRENGIPISAHNARERQRSSPFDLFYFVLHMGREKLYRRIDTRVDAMMEKGLLDEVRKLKARGLRREMISMQGIGYKELFCYLDGEISLEEAVSDIKKGTRHFAKRQITWFKRNPDVIWLNKDEFDDDESVSDEIIRIFRKRMEQEKEKI